jgi:hypothetical protein
MKTSTRFLAAFAVSWLVGVAITAVSIPESSPEDFTLFDLVMFGLVFGLGGVGFVWGGRVSSPEIPGAQVQR